MRTGPLPAHRAPGTFGGSREAHLPAQQYQAETLPRLPRAHAHGGRSRGDPASARSRPQAPGPNRADQADLTPVGDGAPPSRPSWRFPKALRLRRSRDYRRVQGKGRRFRQDHLLACYVRSPHRRVGITVSRKVGGAVVRNRVKRWLREAIRHEHHRLPEGWDVVLIAFSSAAAAGHLVLRDEVRRVFERISTPGRPRGDRAGRRSR